MMTFINCHGIVLAIMQAYNDFNNIMDNLKQYKMNEIINKFLLAGDPFMLKYI